MADEKKTTRPVSEWVVPVLLGWLLPGGGHFYLKRWNHGALLLFAVAGMFIFGLLMRGRMFEPVTGDLFTTVVNVGGYLGDLATARFISWPAGWATTNRNRHRPWPTTAPNFWCAPVC
jgi:hypothetical protein